MKNMNAHQQPHMSSRGFSAVELLATLFIAVVFLAAGYSLYGSIVTRSSQVRHRAQADNVAYDYLRRYEATVPVACVATNPVTNAAVPVSIAGDLPKPIVSVVITCPLSSVSLISKIKVTIKYTEGASQQNVEHEVYASVQ
jgi:prepilin-type N-terminal cleavage/methylation domain-containing protein